MNEILEQALPFWESLTDKQKEEIRNNMVKTECQKKTQLHFGGGECAGVQIIGKGRVRVFITSPGGGDITLFRLLEGDVSILSAACMLNGMDVELDMEMETDCELYTIPKCVYRKLYDESGIVKDYTMEMISEKFSDIMWLFNQFVFSNVASRIASALLDHKVMFWIKTCQRFGTVNMKATTRIICGSILPWERARLSTDCVYFQETAR